MTILRQAALLSMALALAWGEPASAQPEKICPEPGHTLETVKEKLLNLRNGLNASGIVRAAVAPGAGGCPSVQKGEDLQAIAEELVRFAADLGEERRLLARGILQGTSLAFRLKESPPPSFAIVNDPWGPLDDYHLYQPPDVTLPFEALVYAVENGRTGAARFYALDTLFDFEREPRVLAYLLRWARAPSGPPGHAELPERVVGTLIADPPVAGSPLLQALQADPSQITNPRARCWMERGIEEGFVPLPQRPHPVPPEMFPPGERPERRRC